MKGGFLSPADAVICAIETKTDPETLVWSQKSNNGQVSKASSHIILSLANTLEKNQLGSKKGASTEP